MTNCAVRSFYSATMSCTTNCGTSNSCVCCHVHNVAVDNSLVVGGNTTLTTNCPDGKALTVSSCVTQTSGDLAKICGEPGQISLHVNSGRVILDPDDDLFATNEHLSNIF